MLSPIFDPMFWLLGQYVILSDLGIDQNVSSLLYLWGLLIKEYFFLLEQFELIDQMLGIDL